MLRRAVQRITRIGQRSASALPKGLNPRGCVAAPFTPFKQDGTIDHEKIPRYADHLKEFGVPSIFANGTTGEGVGLSVEERKNIAETWMSVNDRYEHIIMHIGAGNLPDSQELARHSESIKVDAIACISPSYFKPQTEDQLVDYMQQVSASAPNTPFYLYDINFMTGIYLSMPRYLELADTRIPQLVGIKHSSIDLSSMMRCHQFKQNKYHILIGSDDLLLPCLPLGLDVTVPSTYMSPLQNKIRQSYYDGDIETAKLWQERCFDVSAVRSRYGAGVGLFTVSRSVMAMLDLDLGPPRLPLTQLPLEKHKALQQDLEQLGFFKWIKELI